MIDRGVVRPRPTTRVRVDSQRAFFYFLGRGADARTAEKAIGFFTTGIDENIETAVADIGYDSPTPIQTKALPPALAGRDVLGCAQTGTGKTAAFALPVLQRLAAGEIRKKGGKRVIRALVLTPTRELAAQIYESFEAYGKYLPVETAVIVGGVSRSRHRRVLEQGADILVATPVACWNTPASD